MNKEGYTYQIGDEVMIVDNTTSGHPNNTIGVIERISGNEITVVSMGSKNWHRPSDLMLLKDIKKIKPNKGDKCTMCGSKDVFNTYHKDDEISLCKTHYDFILDSKNRHSSPTLDVTGLTKKGIIKSDRTWGIELESYAPFKTNQLAVLSTLPDHWGYSGDGTINHDLGMEIKTNPMKNFLGEKTLTDFLTTMTETYKWGVTPTCGTHCHIGVPEYSSKEPADRLALRNLVIMYTILDPVIRCLLPLTRRKSQYCEPLLCNYVGINEKNELVDEQKNTIDIDQINHGTSDIRLMNYRKTRYSCHKFSKYYGINFYSLRNRRTIEVRYHEGTLDPVRLIHWIALHTAIIDICLVDKLDEKSILAFAKITDINELFVKMLALLNKRLKDTTVEYTQNRFNDYLEDNIKSKYIKETRYKEGAKNHHSNPIIYEVPAVPHETEAMALMGNSVPDVPVNYSRDVWDEDYDDEYI